MRFTLELELTDEMLSGADIIYALQDSFRGEAKLALETGVGGVLWTRTGSTIGKWEVTDAPAMKCDDLDPCTFENPCPTCDAIETAPAIVRSLRGFWVVDYDGRRYPFGSTPGSERDARYAAAGFLDGSLDVSRFASNSATWQPLPEDDVYAPTVNAAELPQERLRRLLAIYAAAEISEANGARAQLDEDGKVKQDIATCGTCGKSWNDALITGRTPAPSGRCPYESIHAELAELARLERIDVEEPAQHGRGE